MNTSHALDTNIAEALKFMSRLDAELGMSRAIKNIPKVKMPVPEPAPEGYYEEVCQRFGAVVVCCGVLCCAVDVRCDTFALCCGCVLFFVALLCVVL
jgi:predicted deacylase